MTRTITLYFTVDAGEMTDEEVADEVFNLLETYPYDGDRKMNLRGISLPSEEAPDIADHGAGTIFV